MTRGRGSQTSTSTLGALPAFLAVAALVARWKLGTGFLQPIQGVPAPVFYVACGVLSMLSTVVMIGRREANATVAALGFGSGALCAVLFDAWAGWRTVLWGGEVFAFALVLLVTPLWFGYSLRTKPSEAEPDPADEEPW